MTQACECICSQTHDKPHPAHPASGHSCSTEGTKNDTKELEVSACLSTLRWCDQAYKSVRQWPFIHWYMRELLPVPIPSSAHMSNAGDALGVEEDDSWLLPNRAASLVSSVLLDFAVWWSTGKRVLTIPFLLHTNQRVEQESGSRAQALLWRRHEHRVRGADIVE